MADQEILAAIAKEQAAGHSDDTIKKNLEHAGWSAGDIMGGLALSRIHSLPSAVAPIPILENSPKHVIKTRSHNGAWFVNLLVLALVIGAGCITYYLYKHNELSIFTIQKFLPSPSIIGPIDPSSFTNHVATTTPSASSH